jgi:hypothetical protein
MSEWSPRGSALPEIPKKASYEPREHRDAEPYQGSPISIEQARAMGEAAAIACTDLHYPELQPVITAVARPQSCDKSGAAISVLCVSSAGDGNG